MICTPTRLFCLLSLLLCYCSDSSLDSHNGTPLSPNEEEALPEDMVKVLSSGKSVLLGTNDSNAKSMEKPSMKVVFSYDFFIEKNEVTCGEFNTLMKKETGLQINCKNPLLPATEITYYDAVLYANARSKAEKKDTAYTYSRAIFNDAKNCTSLEGFNLQMDKEAYRLPTEAEWTLVATEGWDPENGWNAANSNYTPQPVCTEALKLSSGICDMAGNVMEWVNDWLGHFRDTTLSNYVGAPDGGSLGERVVKGGSFRNKAAAVN